MARIDGRAADQLRPVEIIPNINQFAEGSCLIRCGSTHVLCCASVEEGAPRHVPEGEGWVTAEYSMLPRANRELIKGKVLENSLLSRREAAEALAEATRSQVVQVIGTKFVLYRPTHKKDKKDKIVLVTDRKRK